jgi:hypothetical protein
MSSTASSLANPDKQLPAGWRSARDRAVTTAGDADGFRVLVADEASAYRWRTAAVLAEPGFDVDEWIGQSCVTGSGDRAVVVYAPRTFTNNELASDGGAFVAVVDLSSGAVRKLALRASLAYYNPGCGSGETVAISTFNSGARPATTMSLVNAATGAVTSTITDPGQVTSAVPVAGGVVAVDGDRLVTLRSGAAAKTLRTESGVLLRLHADGRGGVGYEVAAGGSVQVRRWAGGHSTLLGTARSGDVQVTGAAGRVFVIGPSAGAVKTAAASGWRTLAVPADSEPSTTGALVVLDSAIGGQAPLTAGGAAKARVTAVITATKASVTFEVDPQAMRPSEGRALSPALKGIGAMRPDAVPPPSTVPYDPDRACAVPRNDPKIQTLQATAGQVEWAADLAVQDALTVTRSANWMGSGLSSSWQPQTLFKIHPMTGQVPVQVLLGILAQESNTMQASPHAVDGVTGNVNQGGFYGDGANWSSADCGYGVGQVTTGMSVADGSSVYTPFQQQAIATDYASNIAASLNALIDKWDQLKALNIIANGADPQYIENWYLAAWAYNTGLQPNAKNGNTTGCSPSPTCTDVDGYWGLGWANNPANPNYPADRKLFSANDPFDTKHPNLWPYQEKVIGWAYTPLARFDYTQNNWSMAYSPGVWHNDSTPDMPDYSTFCVTGVNHCSPKSTTDINGNPGAGQCLLMNLHCWWHQPVSWAQCTTDICGTGNLHYAPTDPEPPVGHVYDPDCNASALPSNAVIVDDVTTASAVTCAKNPPAWKSQGAFSLSFPASSPSGCSTNCIIYQGKIDFHQLSTGFGGHLWFTHTQESPSVTATWRPPSSSVGWTRIKVHIPKSGGSTQQADYKINLGNGQTRHRVVNQAWYQNTWVDLGTFNLASGSSVTLSNASPNVTSGYADGGDIAFDALAFIPSTQPLASYVALGDSYSSGESTQPYESDTDQNSPDPGQDECHRSISQAYSEQVKLPGSNQTIAAMAAANLADFHFIACSGAETIDLTGAAVSPGNTDNTDWRGTDYYHYHEVRQVDQSGWLDQGTTLVTVSIGGNDVGFASVVAGCLLTLTLCNNPGWVLTRSFGDYGATQATRQDPEDLVTYQPYLIGQLRGHLAAVYEQIHEYAPNARILVVGYPHLFDTTMAGGCKGMDARTLPWFNQMADLMKTTIKGAIADTIAAFPSTSISFVDAMGPDGNSGFAGHAICEGSAPEWINGPDLVNQASSYHPNANGQAEYAALINAVM